jgi:hypothetical protein
MVTETLVNMLADEMAKLIHQCWYIAMTLILVTPDMLRMAKIVRSRTGDATTD